MRFTGFSLLLALATVTAVSGEKHYQKSTSQSSPTLATGNDKTLSKGLTSNNQLMARQGSAGGSNFCSGRYVTCASCFGPGYTECSDGVTCYNPSDPTTSCSSSSGSSSGYGSDSGSGSSSGSSSGSGSGSSSASGSGSGSASASTTDYCYGKSCAGCFGAGYIECSDGVTCYNPSDPTTSCSSSSGSSSGYGSDSGSGSSSGSSSGSNLGSGSAVTTTAGPSSSTSTTSAASSHTGSTLSSGSLGSPGSSSSSGSSGSSGAPSAGATVRPNGAAGISTPMGVSLGLSGAFALFAIAAM